MTKHPEIRNGKPCIINTRITISDILSYLALGMTIDENLSWRLVKNYLTLF
ncbi:DUF433 domain-containing protein [Flavobacterium sp.]|uniref:DUF433 domain-containing protein n=1 Tax=Flavobacterium sp. TaxID=239 RepID=UPI00343B61F7